ncbi:MAG TPA: protein TolR [Rhodocyclaceae bacterium]
MAKQRRSMAQINVVPYIDVMLVLLVIFMVTAPMIQLGTVDLPTVGKSQSLPVKPIEITVRADRSLMFRDHDSGGKDREVSSRELTQLVRAAQKKNPEQPVLIAGDKAVAYAAVLAVMDQLQKQDVRRVGLLVQPGLN